MQERSIFYRRNMEAFFLFLSPRLVKYLYVGGCVAGSSRQRRMGRSRGGAFRHRGGVQIVLLRRPKPHVSGFVGPGVDDNGLRAATGRLSLPCIWCTKST